MKELFDVLKKVAPASIGAGALTLASNAMATGPDYSVITAAADYSGVSTSTIVIFGAIAAFLVVFTGGAFLLSALRHK